MLGTVAWIALSIFAVIFTYDFLHKRSQRKLHGGEVPSRTERLIGQTAEVTQEIDPIKGTGRVVVAGQDWAAKSSDSNVAVGIKVTIVGADGIVLNVTPEE